MMSAKSSIITFSILFSNKGLDAKWWSFFIVFFSKRSSTVFWLLDSLYSFYFRLMKSSHKKILMTVGVVIFVTALSLWMYFKYIYKTPWEICIDVVKGMFQDIQDGKTAKDRVSKEYWDMITKYPQAYIITDAVFSENKTLQWTWDVVVERKGKEWTQYFSLEKVNEEYKIVTSFNYIFFGNPGYEIDNAGEIPRWWDTRKARLLDSIQKGLKIEITDVKRPYSNDNEWVTWNVKVINTTDYDISNLWLTIYHYDKDNISISPSTTLVPKVSKNWRSEVSWFALHCWECVTHKAEIEIKK